MLVKQKRAERSWWTRVEAQETISLEGISQIKIAQRLTGSKLSFQRRPKGPS